jgi:hypothetical protein
MTFLANAHDGTGWAMLAVEFLFLGGPVFLVLLAVALRYLFTGEWPE